jgi:DNA-binding beta-propeller fold protein YncE
MSGRRLSAALLVLLVAGCSAGRTGSQPQEHRATASTTSSPSTSAPAVTTSPRGGGTSQASPTRGRTAAGVYAGAGAGLVARAARRARPLVYVPETLTGKVTEIDPRTYRVVRRFAVGREPQHVVPSWDLRTLWVNDDRGNRLVPIDPVTGRRGRAVPVADPYNLYFSPDGRHALVMAERLRRIDVRDPHTMRLQRSVRVPCRGVNHADFTADGALMLASCEFSGELLLIPNGFRGVRRTIDLNRIRTPGQPSPAMAASMSGPAQSLEPGATAMPQDVRLAPDGRSFLVADMLRDGVWVVDAARGRVSKFVRTGKGAHGIYPSRDGRAVYVSNRDGASVSVLDASGRRTTARWRLPRGASPDMGSVSVDGRLLWLSGRYDSEVYVISTRSGRLVRRIPVGAGPHGLALWPQPGQHSLGHTGNMR